MQTIYSKIQKSAKLSLCRNNSRTAEITIDGSETISRFCTLAAYNAESLSSRGEADELLFQRLLPNHEDIEIIKSLWEHALTELTAAIGPAGWKAEAHDASAIPASTSGTQTTAKIAIMDFMARCMTADWIRMRGYREITDSELADTERSKEALLMSLSAVSPARKATPRRFPPI